MADATAIWAFVEKGGVVAALSLGIFGGSKFVLAATKSVLNGEWVPGRYYDEISADNDRLRAENDALRTVAFRAVGVAERIGGREEHHASNDRHRPEKG